MIVSNAGVTPESKEGRSRAPSEGKAVCVRVTGRVQGVWYRGWTVESATRRGLVGWVRNRADGTVEAVFAGPDAEVDAMVDDCRVGPPGAYVAAVTVEAELGTWGATFEQRPTV